MVGAGVVDDGLILVILRGPFALLASLAPLERLLRHPLPPRELLRVVVLVGDRLGVGGGVVPRGGSHGGVGGGSDSEEEFVLLVEEGFWEEMAFEDEEGEKVAGIFIYQGI